MKNIHLVQKTGIDRNLGAFFKDTLEEEKLVINFYDKNIEFADCKYYDLYITSDEEIKEGDWFLWQGFSGEWVLQKCEYLFYELHKTNHLNCNFKVQFKVILTTDKDLITEGVQSINDEFLDWFVKNPNCDYIQVESELKCFDKNGLCVSVAIYDTDYTKMMYYLYIPKQETLQEAALNYAKNDETKPYDFTISTLTDAFEAGAIWMSKRTYNEEDLREAFKQSRQAKIFEKDMPPVWESFEDWFEQFKNK